MLGVVDVYLVAAIMVPCISNVEPTGCVQGPCLVELGQDRHRPCTQMAQMSLHCSCVASTGRRMMILLASSGMV